MRQMRRYAHSLTAPQVVSCAARSAWVSTELAPIYSRRGHRRVALVNPSLFGQATCEHVAVTNVEMPPGPEGVPLPQVGLRNGLTQLIVDLESTVLDLKLAYRAAELLLARDLNREIEIDSVEEVEISAMYRGMLISYRRPFTGGAGLLGRQGRNRLDPAIQALPPELQVMHADLLRHTDRHIAHRVEGTEQAEVNIYLTPAGTPHGVVGVGVMALKLMASPEVCENVRLCAGMFLAMLDSHLAHLRERLLTHVQAVPAAEIRAPLNETSEPTSPS